MRDKSKDSLHELLRLRNQTPARLAQIDDLIWRKFGQEKAVLVSDQSGCTRLTRSHGIVHFLAMHHRCIEFSIPILEKSGGHVIKTEGDNIMTLFDEPDAALDAAIALNRDTEPYNRSANHTEHILHCIGISWGAVLCTDDDVFGDAVNTAYKLGEDVAHPGEILICDRTSPLVEAKFQLGSEEEVDLGGVRIHYRRLKY